MQVKDRTQRAGHSFLATGRKSAMPLDAMLLTAAVVSVFVIFAAVLLWGDFQTRPKQRLLFTPRRRPF
jgi:hypothetical protein